MSQPLPDPVLGIVHGLVCRMEEGLQAQSHTVDQAIRKNPSFDANWVESGLMRAVIAGVAYPLGGPDLRIDDLGMGGVEAVSSYEGVERRFRMRKARRNRWGELVVTVSSDSFLTLVAKNPTLFDGEEQWDAPAPSIQQWVLAYMLQPGTRTFLEVSAGRVVDFLGSRPPYRLVLADQVRIPHSAPLPPDFKPATEEDLDLGDEGEEGTG